MLDSLGLLVIGFQEMPVCSGHYVSYVSYVFSTSHTFPLTHGFVLTRFPGWFTMRSVFNGAKSYVMRVCLWKLSRMSRMTRG